MLPVIVQKSVISNNLNHEEYIISPSSRIEIDAFGVIVKRLYQFHIIIIQFINNQILTCLYQGELSRLVIIITRVGPFSLEWSFSYSYSLTEYEFGVFDPEIRLEVYMSEAYCFSLAT